MPGVYKNQGLAYNDHVTRHLQLESGSIFYEPTYLSSLLNGVELALHLDIW